MDCGELLERIDEHDSKNTRLLKLSGDPFNSANRCQHGGQCLL
jgi:hypothetical protein